MRKQGEAIWEGKAHDDSIGGLSLSAITRGLLATAGHDQVSFLQSPLAFPMSFATRYAVEVFFGETKYSLPDLKCVESAG